MCTRPAIKIYKPREICKDPTPEALRKLKLPEKKFIRRFKDEIEKELSVRGLSIRLATFADILPLETFIQTCFKPEEASEVSPYDLFRFIQFGHGLLLENNEPSIVGCVFEIPYDTPDKVSFLIRLGIDKNYVGVNLGKSIMEYSCLIAMEHGSKVKKAVVDFDNFPQICIMLNKAGWIFDSYYPDAPGMGTVFSALLPLSKRDLTLTAIAREKLEAYLAFHIDGVDYKIIDPYDTSGITRLYQCGDFVIAALIKQEASGTANKFVAFPRTRQE
ncbi:MAG: GNAT family N-acetyltransferase [Chitinispirillaceae bacterium]|nr:GNAT family N-acetyltransferase [Chitinispirillaceae bacterium]